MQTPRGNSAAVYDRAPDILFISMPKQPAHTANIAILQKSRDHIIGLSRHIKFIGIRVPKILFNIAW